METFAIFYMITSTIWLVFIFFRLRDIDHNVDEHTRLIRHDIMERGSHISGAVSDCALQVSNMEKNLITEIACLATKNNEDIKRSKEGFLVGDVIEYAGEETLVLDRERVTLNIGEEQTDYIIWNVSKGIQHETAYHLEHNAKFLRRASLKE